MNIAAMLLPENVVIALGWTLLHSLWQGALAALGFAVVLYFSRRTSARARYAMGLAVLALVLLIAIITFWNYFSAAAATRPASGMGTVVSAPALPGAEAGQGSVGGPPLSQRIAAFFSDYFGRHLPLIVTLWLLGVLFLTLRFSGSLLYVQRLKYRQNRPLPAPWPERLQALAAKAGLRRPLQLLESLRLKTPVVIGHLKPVLLLPAGLVSGLPADEVEALLAHELAHVLRRDYLVNVLQSLVDILFFFHPGMRWISAAVRQEREHCCDDFAVELCGDPRGYARALARLQGAGPGTPKPALAAAGSGHRLLRRIARLLGKPNLAHDFREGFMSALLLVVGLLGMLKLATAAGNVASPAAAATAAGKVEVQEKEAPAQLPVPLRFEIHSFDLLKGGTVKLSGSVRDSEQAPAVMWLVDASSGHVLWYMPLSAKADNKGMIRFDSELFLAPGAYGCYLPAGSDVSVQWKTPDGKGPWIAMALRSGNTLLREERDELLLRAERGEELLRRKKEDHRLQEDLTRAEAERSVREDEARLRAGKEKLRQEERAMRLEEAERLRAEKERLREEKLRARSDEERKRLDAELKRTEEKLRKQEEALRRQEQEMRLQSDLELKRSEEEMRKQEQELSVQEKLLQAQEQRLKVKEENFNKFLAELVKAGLVSEADGYRIKLSAAALVINGKRQPREVFEKYRQLYESLTGTQVEGKRTITFVNEKD